MASAEPRRSRGEGSGAKHAAFDNLCPGSTVIAPAEVDGWLAYWVAATPLWVLLQTPLPFAALRLTPHWCAAREGAARGSDHSPTS